MISSLMLIYFTYIFIKFIFGIFLIIYNNEYKYSIYSTIQNFAISFFLFEILISIIFIFYPVFFANLNVFVNVSTWIKLVYSLFLILLIFFLFNLTKSYRRILRVIIGLNLTFFAFFQMLYYIN